VPKIENKTQTHTSQIWVITEYNC